MKQGKKLFTRMLINNWGGIDHKIIELNEYVNLFSGKSGSGKSTVMDAMQVVLYGSVRNDFLNKAADDTRNKRSVLSYLRGAQKDGTSNRENQDFHAQIVLEIYDTGMKSTVCAGVIFEVGRNDLDLKKYSFFSHAGKMPEDEYLSGNHRPYSFEDLQQLIKERSVSKENRIRMNINRIYPTQEAYLNALNDVIFGYVDAGRFKTMQKSAIALRMTNGTSQFIKDYMFPKSREDTISALSEQLAAYREIKEQVEVLEQEIELLTRVQSHDRELVKARAEQVKCEEYLKILDIENRKAHLEAREQDLLAVSKKLSELEEELSSYKESISVKRQELIKVQVELKSSELERKKEDLLKVKEFIELCAEEAADWRNLQKRLRQWEEAEGIGDYLSNPICNRMDQILKGKITEENFEEVKRGLKETYGYIEEELNDLRDEYKEQSQKHREKSDILTDLRNDKKHYRKELKEVRSRLKQELTARFGKAVSVDVLADLFDVTDEEWRNAIEGRLGRIKYGLVVDPAYTLEAAKIFRRMKRPEYESVDLINTEAIMRDNPSVKPGTLYEAVTTEIPYIDACLKRYLGRIEKCETVEELHASKNGVTKDCYSHSSYMFSHLKKKDYQYQTIGKKVSQKQLQELEKEVRRLTEKLIGLEQQMADLKPAHGFERLENYEYSKLLRLSQAGEQLKKYNEQASRLEQEIRELEKGTRMEELLKQEERLKAEIETMDRRMDDIYDSRQNYGNRKGELKKEIQDKKEALEALLLGFVPNPVIQEEIEAILRNGKGGSFARKQEAYLAQLKEKEEQEFEARAVARTDYIRQFPRHGLGGAERENTAYDRRLMECQKDFEPKYKAEFNKQYDLVYQMLRENVIATIHSEIKAAKRHRREINNMLAKIRFSDSIYQIDILPAEDENKQFYEMLMAEELDMKVIGPEFDGQLSFGEDEFYQKYEAQIRRLTEKFMPPKEADQAARNAFKKNMEKYADYRTYLSFSMYEKTEDAKGNVKKNYVDDMAGRDSGGEGQNPKYVALMAGFAMLYMQQTNRDSKIRLVLLDEAFSKMDKERSEVCLHYARQLGLQLIVCVPDERLPSLIRNVDSVYAFRRHLNRISMIHIDKGDYFKMMEGETDEDAGSVAD